MTDSDSEQPPEVDPELEELGKKVEQQMMEVQARGGNLPLGPLRVETLVEFLIPQGSLERVRFEKTFLTRLSALLDEALAAARRQALTQGVPGGAAASAVLGKQRLL